MAHALNYPRRGGFARPVNAPGPEAEPHRVFSHRVLMRRRALMIVLAGLVVIVFVSIGAAVTFDRGPLSTRAAVVSPLHPVTPATPWSEAGTLILTGGILIGLAAVVRRAG
jgi:hypothetical protein